MMIQEIPYASALYEASKELRNNVLRLPLGMVLNDRDVAGEEEQIHIGAVTEDAKVLASVTLKPLSTTVIKLRQMAVDASQQGSGLGRKLVMFAEQLAYSKGYRVMETHARVVAQGFYEKLGYVAEGKMFVEIGIEHMAMKKALTGS